MTPRPHGPASRARPAWPIVVVMALAAAYTAYAAHHQVGLAGWLDSMQQHLFGDLTKLSALIAITWAVGLGSWGWQDRQIRADAQARFEPLRAQDPYPAYAPTHLALAGRLRPELALRHEVGSGAGQRVDHLLVPLTAAPDGANAHALVRYVVRLPPAAVAQPAADGSLPMRVDAPLPAPAAQAFARAGVQVASDARVLRPTPPGHAAAAQARSARERISMLKICLGASAMLTLVVGALAALARQRRGVAHRT